MIQEIAFGKKSSTVSLLTSVFYFQFWTKKIYYASDENFQIKSNNIKFQENSVRDVEKHTLDICRYHLQETCFHRTYLLQGVLLSTIGIKQIPSTTNKTVQRPNHQPTK